MGSQVQPIALQVQTPAPASPLQTVGSLMQLKSGLAEQALRQQQLQQSQAQTADIQAQAEGRRRDLNDQNLVQSAMRDPDKLRKFSTGDFSDLAGQVQPKTLQGLAINHQDLVDKQTTQGKAALELDIAKKGQLGGTIDSLIQTAKGEGGIDRANEQLKSAWPSLVAEKLVPPGAQLPTLSSVDDLERFAAQNDAGQVISKLALDRQSKQAADAKNKAEAEKAMAEAGKNAAEGDIAQQKATLMRSALADYAQYAGGNGQHPIDKALPPSVDQQANASFKADYDDAMSKGDLEAAHKAQTAAAGHAAALSPTVLKNKAATAAAEASARAPIETAAHINSAVGTERALAALAPEGARNILDTSTRNKVVADRIKAGDEYSKSVGEAQQLADYVEAAKSGNQAAAANVPIEALRSIVSRVNRQELERQGGQSWARRIEDYADKGFSGKPSTETLHDYEQLAHLAQNKAGNIFGGTMDNLNSQGATYSRTPPTTPQAAAASSKPAVQRGTQRSTGNPVYSLDGGKTWLLGQPPSQ